MTSLSHPAGTNHSPPADAPVAESVAYAELSRIVFADQPLSETLGKVAQLARRTIPQHPEVSVTLVQGERARTAAFTGDLAVELDERQYEQGFGPCLEAAVAGRTIKLTTDHPEGLYASFCGIARRQGVTHTMSLGLPVAAPLVAGLNCYSTAREPFSPEAERIAGTFASFAGIVLANLGSYHSAADLAAQLQAALQSRAVIEQAKGMLMAERRCSSDEAFQLLIRWSQERNVKLREVARALVERTSAAG